MARIKRHKTVQLTTGGWVDLKDCEVLWAPTHVYNWWNHVNPGGLFRARTNEYRMLLRTPKGSLITVDHVRVAAWPASGMSRWSEVSDADAFIWLQRYSPRFAKRLFPEQASLQGQGALAGQR